MGRLRAELPLNGKESAPGTFSDPSFQSRQYAIRPGRRAWDMASTVPRSRIKQAAAGGMGKPPAAAVRIVGPTGPMMYS